MLALVEKADVLIEGFRPGVTERLGLGPDACTTRNPRLVYGRVTGWGQDGPLAQAAGHDINYIAICGALHAIGRAGGAPVPPLNLIGDFGGGAHVSRLRRLACALVERQSSGRGQVIDAAMSDGAASLMSIFYGRMAAGAWRDERGVNVARRRRALVRRLSRPPTEIRRDRSDRGRFYAELIERLGLDPATLPGQPSGRAGGNCARACATCSSRKPAINGARCSKATTSVLRRCCRSPRPRRIPTIVARATFVERDGVVQPAPAPRFSRTPGRIARGAPRRGQGGAAALAEWGFDAAAIARFRAAGALLAED